MGTCIVGEWWKDRTGTGNLRAIMAREASHWETQIGAARDAVNMCVE